MKDNKKSPLTEQELKNFDTSVAKCGLPLIWFILKTMTDEEHPLSIGDLYKEINSLISPLDGEEYFSIRTVRRIMESVLFLNEIDHPDISALDKLMCSIMGGKITYNESDKGQKRFFFEPFLKASDMNLVFTSLQSFRYLSDEEKSFILERLRLLHPCFDLIGEQLGHPLGTHVTDLPDLPDRPKRNINSNTPVDSSMLLRNIHFIDTAIREKRQIEVVYGEYTKQIKSLHPGFTPRHQGEPYIINPYALMWNDGECYLIGTHDNYDNPVHFRVDRMINVTFHMNSKVSGEIDFAKRDPIPQILTPYFTQEAGYQPVFDSIAYANKYPKMQIYGTIHKVNPVFECTSRSLQIIVDNFGPNLILSDTPIEHSEDEFDINGDPLTFFTAQVQGVQYENALNFAFSHADTLTLLNPPELVDDLRDKLQKTLNKYAK